MIRNVNIGTVCLDPEMPKICVPVSGSSKEEVTWEIGQVHQTSCDIIEWRIDCFREDIVSAIGSIKAAAENIPVLITYRRAEEGGKGLLDDKAYCALMKEILFCKGVDAVDIELNRSCCRELVELAAKHRVTTVVSYHNFDATETAEEIESKLNLMESIGADIPKVAYMPKSFQDVLTLLNISEKVSKKNFPIITVSMGKLGKISRICGELSGSSVTFASCKTGSAPGQIKAVRMKELLEEIHKER